MPSFLFAIFAVSVLAGGVASVSGFGIGSLLTPLLALQIDLRLAVAAVSIPHFFATVLRCWLMRQHINREVFVRFGIASAVGGLAGALFHNAASNHALIYIFGCLLIFAGFCAMTGLSAKMKIPQQLSWLAGVASGGFGGIVGNQGGIRSAALLSCGLERDAFVATGTAIGVIVDVVRMPVYFYTQGHNLYPLAPWIAIATVGVLAGTIWGKSILAKISEKVYRAIVGGLILALGVYELVK